MGNREIKFRAWNTKHKYMDDTVFIRTCDGRVFDVPSVRFDTPNTEIESSDDLIIMQYTGLKDANGVEIYEGDIVKMFYQDWLDKTEVIKFKDGTFGYGGDFHFSAFHCLAQDMRGAKYHFSHALTVIGNIYQNQELLNG